MVKKLKYSELEVKLESTEKSLADMTALFLEMRKLYNAEVKLVELITKQIEDL